MLFRRHAAGLIAACLSLLTLTAAAPLTTSGAVQAGLGDDQSLPFPLTDPFYLVPDNIDTYAPGEIIRSRVVEPKILIGALLDKTTQIFYRTTDAQGKATATVGTIWKPLYPSLQGDKILSYQLAEDALSLNCAPSFAWVNGSSNNDFIAGLEGRFVVPYGLYQGWYIFSPDHQGRKSSFVSGHLEGPHILDGIRATQNYYNFERSSTRVAIYGYSGAGHASAWAASLAASYAPDLYIVGVAVGGVPVDKVTTIEHINTKDDAPLAGAGVFGLGNGYPELNQTFTDDFTDTGRVFSFDLRNPNTCLVMGPAQTKYKGYDIFTAFKSGRAILDNAIFAPILRKESLLTRARGEFGPAPVYQYPTLIWHGDADVTVPYQPEADYVAQQCAAKATGNTNIRFVTLPGFNHQDTLVVGLVAALDYLRSALALKPQVVKCGSNSLLSAVLQGLPVVGGVVQQLPFIRYGIDELNEELYDKFKLLADEFHVDIPARKLLS